MRRVDRLGWATGVAFEIHGVRMGVRISADGYEEMLDRFLPPGRRALADASVDHVHSLLIGGAGARPGVRRFHVVYSGGEVVARTHELRDALEVLEASMRLLVAIHARRRLFVHAGAVDLCGSGVVLPGVSGSGKSTLVEALLSAGATYYSDEYAVLGSGGWLHPYSLDLRRDGSPGRPSERVSARELGARAASAPARVGLVLLTRYKPGAVFRPRRLAPSTAVMKVVRHAVSVRFRPGFALDRLIELAERVPVHEGDRPDTASVIGWLKARCAS